MDPGAVLLAPARLGQPVVAPRGLRAVRLHGRRRHGGRARVTAPRCCASRARPRRSSRPPTATRRSARWIRTSGAALSVAEATRNVAITGARPLGVTNCLNYGDPTRPEAFWQLSEGVRGLGDACRALGLPVTGGNVSLYNESPDGSIAPTPEIGVVGLLDDIGLLVGPAFVAEGDAILLVGECDARACPGRPTRRWPARPWRTARRRSTSRARPRSRRSSARPSRAGSWRSAQDVSGGGLAVALAEGAMWGGLGAAVRLAAATSPAVELFGESPSRLVRDRPPRFAPALTLLARQHGLPVEELGTVGGERLVIELVGAGATGASEERGSRIADALEVPARRPAPRLGPRPGPRPRLGGLTGCAASSARSSPAPSRRRRPRSRPSACSRSSTAARNRPASRSATASS